MSAPVDSNGRSAMVNGLSVPQYRTLITLLIPGMVLCVGDTSCALTYARGYHRQAGDTDALIRAVRIVPTARTARLLVKWGLIEETDRTPGGSICYGLSQRARWLLWVDE